MKRIGLILYLCGQSVFGFAQWNFSVGYNYMVAGGWDRAIQTYNFARPELTDKQPLLIHGVQLSYNYLFRSEKPMQHGFLFSYRYFRSAAQNENFNAAINVHLVNIGYLYHGKNLTKASPFFVDVSVSVLLGGIFRNVNGDPLRDDESRIWAPGIGGELRPRIGYDLLVKEKWTFSPYLQTTYCPFYYSPRAEAMLNQTIGLTGPKYTGILSLEVGICFSRTSEEKKTENIK